jgi:hypothetical protein
MNKMISDDYAVYLPAVNEQYAGIITRPIPNNRPFPSAFTINDLMFWKGNNKLFYHSHFLNSVGAYAVGSTPDNAVTRRGRTDGTLFGDSGGYQIGTGNLKGINTLKADMEADDACYAWREAYEARLWILGFLETYTNYAMTIDMPLWAQSKAGTPFSKCSTEQLIALTVENLQFIDSHRQGNTKWLNVMQGSNMATFKQWWDAVKWFKGSGYALSSLLGKTSGLSGLLEPLLMMRDENAFAAGNDWIHMLGVSTAPWAIMFTAIQKAMQANVNPNLRISYDSASPFQDAGIREELAILPDLDGNMKNWVIRKQPIPQSRDFLNSPLTLSSVLSMPTDSPISKLITLGHLNVNDDQGMYTRKQLDTLSLAFAINHNVWTYLETFKQANDIAFASSSNKLPSIYKECLDSISYIFTVENWASELIKEKSTLDNFK